MVVKLLRQQTDILFFIEDDVSDEMVSADFRNLSIGFGIKKLLEGTGINHAVIGDADGTQAIFIGSSQEPQASYKRADKSTIRYPQKGPNSRNFRVVKPAPPQKSNASDSKNSQPEMKPAISIPTGGGVISGQQIPISGPKPIANTEKQKKKKQK
jgi:hypothetical protein